MYVIVFSLDSTRISTFHLTFPVLNDIFLSGKPVPFGALACVQFDLYPLQCHWSHSFFRGIALRGICWSRWEFSRRFPKSSSEYFSKGIRL